MQNSAQKTTGIKSKAHFFIEKPPRLCCTGLLKTTPGCIKASYRFSIYHFFSSVNQNDGKRAIGRTAGTVNKNERNGDGK